MKHGDWYYEYSDDFKVWRKGEAYFAGIKDDLLWLSQQVNGNTLANDLWTMYAPPNSLRRPDFLRQATPDTTEIQQPSQDHNQISQLKPAQIRGQQRKKIKRPGQRRPGM
jgi:hypothetical protein